MELPSRLERRIRRKPLPIVVPKPRSKGSAMNLPYVELSVSCSTVTTLGNSRPRHRMCIERLPGVRGRWEGACGAHVNSYLARAKLDNQLHLCPQRKVVGAWQAADNPFGDFAIGAGQIVGEIPVVFAH